MKHWVFGAIVRGVAAQQGEAKVATGKVRLARFMNKNIQTLIPLLRRCVHGDSLIVSDGLPTYTDYLNDANGFPFYQWLVHGRPGPETNGEFAHRLDRSVNTNTIERFWRSVREYIGCYDVRGLNLDLHLYSCVYSWNFWRKVDGTYLSTMDNVRTLVRHIVRFYPGPFAEPPEPVPFIHENLVPRNPIQWPPGDDTDLVITPVEGINIAGVEYEGPFIPLNRPPREIGDQWEAIDRVAGIEADPVWRTINEVAMDVDGTN